MMPNDTAPAWPDMLTCPHCGGDELAHGFQYPPPQGTAQCYSCGAAVIADTEEEAIATWNRRTPSEQSAREAAAFAAGAREMREKAAETARTAVNKFGVLPHEAIRALPIDTTALDRLLAEARDTGRIEGATVGAEELTEAREEGRRGEREACALIANEVGQRFHGTALEDVADEISGAIRARSTPA